jgi:predicted nucleotidyltransferase component of viral defense system
VPRPERGQTPAGFRHQVLQRLRNEALRTGVPVQRLQQRVAYERLLARLAGGDWVLKGGFALQLRYGLLARPTKDVDVRTALPVHEALERLRRTVEAARLADHFDFDLGPAARELQGAPGGSLRVRVVARIAGTAFVTFHVDLSSGDALVGPPDVLPGSDLLAFAGVEPVAFPVYPVAQHLAEKLHAHTLPRAEENTRVRDLVDLVTVAAVEPVEAGRLRASVAATFAARGSHAVPACLPEPPASWDAAFDALTREAADAPTHRLAEGHAFAAAFWDPILSGAVEDGSWRPRDRRWSSAP